MALTAAERAKRHREKLKNDPQKFEEHKKKHAAVVKASSKKITQLSEDQKEKQRKKWRDQKRNQKQNKKINEDSVPSASIQNVSKKVHKKKDKSIKYAKKYKVALKTIQTLNRSLETTKKNLYRLKVKTNKTIRDLETRMLKMKTREEVLESTIKKTYKDCQTQKEKRVLKRLADTDIVKRAQQKCYMTKLLGLKGKIRKRKITVKNNIIMNETKCFYLRDDISRCTAGKRECRTEDKKKEQIRYLTDTIGNLYQIYKSEGGKYSISTFYKYKPFYVLAPNVQNRETCLCIKHENFEMLLQAIHKSKLLLNCKTVADVTSKVSCDLLSFGCMHGECDKCKPIKLDYQLTVGQLEQDTHWTQWERVDHTYKKTEKGMDKTLHTKKTAKVLKQGSVATLIKSFENSIPAFKMHYYTWKHQQQKYRECINGLNQNEALILCDFSENYMGKLANEIQSMHFGASKQQITIHTGMVYWATSSQSFCSVSDNNCHEPAAIWAHLIPVIKMVKAVNPETKIIHFFSDGPSSQYRQKKNFYLHNLFTSKLKLECSTWSFTESGHGKGVADGIGGAVKRSLDRQVAYGKDVMNSSQAYDLLTKSMKSVRCFHIQDPDIENMVKIIPKDLSVVPGTMKIHQIVSRHEEKNIMKHRTHSCFCGAKKGLCGCFNPKTFGFCTTGRTTNNLEIQYNKNNTPSDTIPVDTNNNNSRTKTSSNADKDLDEIALSRNNNNNLEVNQEELILTSSIEDTDLDKITILGSDLCEKFPETGLISPSDLEMLECIEISELYSEDIRTVDLCPNEPEPSEKPLMVLKCNNNTQRLTVSSNSSPEPKKRCLMKKKENVQLSSAKRPSIKMIVNRTLRCEKCNIQFPFQRMQKCMACKLFFCLKCSDGSNHFDYICDICYGV